MAKLSKSQEYVLAFLEAGKTAIVWGGRVQFSGIDRGSASTIFALERRGLVEEFFRPGGGYGKMRFFRKASAQQGQ